MKFWEQMDCGSQKSVNVGRSRLGLALLLLFGNIMWLGRGIPSAECPRVISELHHFISKNKHPSTQLSVKYTDTEVRRNGCVSIVRRFDSPITLSLTRTFEPSSCPHAENCIAFQLNAAEISRCLPMATVVPTFVTSERNG